MISGVCANISKFESFCTIVNFSEFFIQFNIVDDMLNIGKTCLILGKKSILLQLIIHFYLQYNVANNLICFILKCVSSLKFGDNVYIFKKM